MASPKDMTATMVANLKARTGKTLAQWLVVTKKSGLKKHGQIVKLLKGEHGVTHGYANLVAHESLGGVPSVASSSVDLVATQYAGKKADLRPIYDALIDVVSKFGRDVEVAPKKAYVSLRRSKQFALIQPSTATRVDVGFVLKGEAAGKRLEASGSFNSMCTHRVRLGTKKDVNAELKKWLKEAYQAS